ncbi:Flagellar assembly factor FliW [bioreactor metagenome]|uniref:Flagellar assembly factor FliW n=1 Tax=bioreactor metagenome TaxID=1076179 RepID=A0A645E750_9ZZZZ
MQVNTYLFGTVDVAEDKVISFPNGLIGFEDKKQFMLAHEEGKAEPQSFTLQSVDDAALAFQIIDPTALGFNYELELTDEENALLQSPAADDVAVMITLYKQEEGGSVAPGLRAPLIINLKARVGLQKLLAQMTTNVTLSNLVNKV